MVKFDAEILEIRTISEEVKIFYLSTNSHFSPRPGQYAWLSLPEFSAAPMAIASSATEDKLIFAIRKWGSLTTELFNKNSGDNIIVDGPFGTPFPTELIPSNEIIYLIAGGTGITPIRSLVKYTKESSKFELFYGVKSDDELIFLQDISKWSIKSNLILEEPSSLWKGKYGLVTDLLEEKSLNNQGLVFVCGPPKMMSKIVDHLRAQGFEDDKIFVSLEKFDKLGNVVGPVLPISDPQTGFNNLPK